MDGGVKPFRWIALFRDGHTIEQLDCNVSPALRQAALSSLFDYLNGTPDNPKRHYLLWFKLTNGELEYSVNFDHDGDAYIDLPDGGLLMTEFKIRSAELLYMREQDNAEQTITYILGFYGINTCDKYDGKTIAVVVDNSHETVAELAPNRAMMSV